MNESGQLLDYGTSPSKAIRLWKLGTAFSIFLTIVAYALSLPAIGWVNGFVMEVLWWFSFGGAVLLCVGLRPFYKTQRRGYLCLLFGCVLLWCFFGPLFLKLLMFIADDPTRIWRMDISGLLLTLPCTMLTISTVLIMLPGFVQLGGRMRLF